MTLQTRCLFAIAAKYSVVNNSRMVRASAKRIVSVVILCLAQGIPLLLLTGTCCRASAETCCQASSSDADCCNTNATDCCNAPAKSCCANCKRCCRACDCNSPRSTQNAVVPEKSDLDSDDRSECEALSNPPCDHPHRVDGARQPVTSSSSHNTRQSKLCVWRN